jgi:alkylated DNA repair dioxygenase AlkB
MNIITLINELCIEKNMLIIYNEYLYKLPIKILILFENIILKNFKKIPENKKKLVNTIMTYINYVKISKIQYIPTQKVTYTVEQAQFIIQTTNSFLSLRKYQFGNLIDNCVKNIEGKLLINPPIRTRWGKMGIQHRNIGFFSNDSIGYYYSKQLAKSQPLTHYLFILLYIVNKIYDTDFNAILINEYLTCDDYISAHSDDENNLSNIGVVAISYGQSRIFRIRDKNTKKIIKDISTKSDELLHMAGDFQKEFTHEIPKILKKEQKNCKGKRISFTFRKHLK